MGRLNHAAQRTLPFILRQTRGTPWPLTVPKDLAQELEHCPLRYIFLDCQLKANGLSTRIAGGAVCRRVKSYRTRAMTDIRAR